MSIDNIEVAEAAEGGVSRRKLIKAAAWSAPVIAVAAATPLAAASPGQANTAAFVGSNISAQQSAGTASGTYANSGGTVSNVTGSWSTGTLRGTYELTGPWTSASLTKPDGTAFIQGETIIRDGIAWTVTFASVSNDDGEWVVQFQTDPITVTSNTTVLLPAAIYSGTFVAGSTGPGRPTFSNPIAASVSFAAAAVNSGEAIGSSSVFPSR